MLSISSSAADCCLDRDEHSFDKQDGVSRHDHGQSDLRPSGEAWTLPQERQPERSKDYEKHQEHPPRPVAPPRPRSAVRNLHHPCRHSEDAASSGSRGGVRGGARCPLLPRLDRGVAHDDCRALHRRRGTRMGPWLGRVGRRRWAIRARRSLRPGVFGSADTASARVLSSAHGEASRPRPRAPPGRPRLRVRVRQRGATKGTPREGAGGSAHIRTLALGVASFARLRARRVTKPA